MYVYMSIGTIVSDSIANGLYTVLATVADDVAVSRYAGIDFKEMALSLRKFRFKNQRKVARLTKRALAAHGRVLEFFVCPACSVC